MQATTTITKLRAGSLLAALALLTTTSLVSAQPRTAGALQLGLGYRYGAEQNDGDFNPWGHGLGVDGGYTMNNAVYLGGDFDYFFGEKVDTSLGSVEGNLWQLMAEGGYDVGLGDSFVARPKLGLGVAHRGAEACGLGVACIDSSEADFALAPGLKLMLFTRSFSLAFDMRYAFVFGDDTAKAVIFSAGIGL
jgi:Outer membrane protein beta-barrel domain